MVFKVGVIMDPIASIHVNKDSTLAMLLEAQKRNWQLFYMEQRDLFWRDGIASARTRELQVFDNSEQWFTFTAEKNLALKTLDVILMRKDPPVDRHYLYTTQLLDQAEQEGVLVVNKPQSLRDFNEKLFISWFPQCCAETLITSDVVQVREFLQKHRDIVCKPLHGMGGVQVFRLTAEDPNVNVVVEMLSDYGQHLILAQRFIPEITQGDKRILLIDGKPIPYALARLAKPGETRANLATGGTGVAVKLTKRDHWICEQIAPVLRQKGLLFVGIDVIGDYLTEINITSPTCIRELDRECNINISAQLLDCLATKMR